MALSAKSKSSELLPMRLSVEMSPAAYRAILAFLEMNASTSTDELLEALEGHLSGVLVQALTEVTGVAPSDATLLQEVEVELRVVQRSSEIDVNDVDDEDEPDPVEGFRQAWHDAMTGNTRPASILWDDSFWNSPDAE